MIAKAKPCGETQRPSPVMRSAAKAWKSCVRLSTAKEKSSREKP